MSPLSAPFTLEIPDHWTPELALAVFELLNELTDTLWNRYSKAIIELLAGEPAWAIHHNLTCSTSTTRSPSENQRWGTLRRSMAAKRLPVAFLMYNGIVHCREITNNSLALFHLPTLCKRRSVQCGKDRAF